MLGKYRSIKKMTIYCSSEMKICSHKEREEEEKEIKAVLFMFWQLERQKSWGPSSGNLITRELYGSILFAQRVFGHAKVGAKVRLAHVQDGQGHVGGHVVGPLIGDEASTWAMDDK